MPLLGLPNHLTPRYATHAYASAMHAAAIACLALAAVELFAYSADRPGLILWPALVALVPTGIALAVLDRYRTTFHAVAYLVLGAAALYWYAIVGTFELQEHGRTDAFVFSLPKLALVFVGAGRSGRGIIVWAVSGYLLGEGAIALAALQSGATVEPDIVTLVPIVSLVTIVLIISLTRRIAVRTQPVLARARRDAQVAAERQKLESRAAAILHDTVLGHLAAISNAGPGELPDTLRDAMTRDLALLVGEEWLLRDEPLSPGSAWVDSALYEAIASSRDEGLEVEVSGDPGVVARLSAPQATALGLAARQCLVNVIRHAGVTRAQVVLYGGADGVSVMILDEGVGFDVDGTGRDRLGLAQSVRRRIESVGGSVRVWSTPGFGTSIVIGMPFAADRAVVES